MGKDILNTPMPKPVILHGMENDAAYMNYRARESLKRVMALCSKYPVLKFPETLKEMECLENIAKSLGHKCFEIKKRGRGAPN